MDDRQLVSMVKPVNKEEGYVPLAERVKREEAANKNNIPPAMKEYLFLIKGAEGYDDCWDIIIGRDNAYEYVKDNIESINVEKSYVLSDETPLSKRNTVYNFFKFIKQKYYPDDVYDIEEYIVGDVMESDNEEAFVYTAGDHLEMSDLMMQGDED